MKKQRDPEQQMVLAGTEEGEILGRLTERVERAVTLIQELRKERDQLRAKLEKAEAQLAENDGASSRLATIEEEQDRLRKERSEIRNRIETILGSLEALD